MSSLKELLAKQFLEPSHVCDHDFMICAANHTLNDEFKDASEAISYLSKPLYRQAKTLRFRMKDYEHLSEFHANQAQA